MELEQIAWMLVALVAGIFVVWVVWALFCQAKGNPDQDTSDPEDSDTFSSTHVITSVRGKKLKRKKRTRRTDESKYNNDTTDEECEGVDRTEQFQSGRKKGKSKTSYRYQESKYGLHDPFGEWAPKTKQTATTPTLPTLHKNKSLDHTAIDL